MKPNKSYLGIQQQHLERNNEIADVKERLHCAVTYFKISYNVTTVYNHVGGFQGECCLFSKTCLSSPNLPRTTVNKTSGLQTHKVLSVFIKLIKMSNCVLRWKYSASQPTPTWRHLIFSLRVIVSECFVFVTPSLKVEDASALPESSVRSLVSWAELWLYL